MKRLFYFLAAGLLAMQGCSKNVVTPSSSLEGTYTGKFYHYNGAVVPVEKITVRFEADRYRSAAGSNRQPAGGSGNYILDTENGVLKFEDKNVWTTEFDWNLILNGTYKYSLKGDSLILAKTLVESSTRYEYRLKKN